jgi:hypothetical protein
LLLYSQVKGLRACVIQDYAGFVKNRLIGTLEPPQTHHPSQARGISAWTALRISLARPLVELPRARTAEGGSRIARSYILTENSELKAHQKREFLRMRHGNSSFLGKVRFLI